jgi:hypothetical protein
MNQEIGRKASEKLRAGFGSEDNLAFNFCPENVKT